MCSLHTVSLEGVTNTSRKCGEQGNNDDDDDKNDEDEYDDDNKDNEQAGAELCKAQSGLI